MTRERDTEPNPILDLTEQAEVADEDSEAIASSRSRDGDNEVTPTAKRRDATDDRCRECHGPILRFEDFIPPPTSADDAWRMDLATCYGTNGDTWCWCPRAGVVVFFGRWRVNVERRSRPREANQETPGPQGWKRKPAV